MTQVDVTEKTKVGLSGVKIAVDLTPMLPGGENGGAKLMTLELISALANLLPETSFMLLTAESSNVELGWLETKHSNIQRMCVLHNNLQTNSFVAAPSYKFSWRIKTFHQLKVSVTYILRPELKQRIKAMFLSMANWRSRTFEQLKAFAKYVLPTKLKQRIKYRLSTIKPETGPKSLLSQIGANLLFCPFTAPFYADPLIPTVSVIYDLQYRAYPQFFTPEESIERENNFRIACQKAHYLVAISKFVRQTVIETANFPPERVIAVPIGLLHAKKQIDNELPGIRLLLEKIWLTRW